jgi:hypothetical protein
LAEALTSTAQLEAVEPVLALNSAAERDYHPRDIDRLLMLARDYALDEARREQIDAGLGYGRYSSEEGEARRADLRAGAQRLRTGRGSWSAQTGPPMRSSSSP